MSTSKDTHRGPGRQTPVPRQRPALADAAKLQQTGPGNHARAAVRIGPNLRRIPMSSGVWVVSTDETEHAPLPRGLYQQERDENGTLRYAPRAALPYVHARITRRDGAGRQITTNYLISAEPDRGRVVVSSRLVHSGEWAGAVGMALSDDPKIIAAAGTAIRTLGHDLAVTEREAVPRVGPDGQVMIPAAETLPAGYLTVGPVARPEALRRFAEVITPVAAANPHFALVLGASAVSPFAGWLDYCDCRAFIVDMAGKPNGGKSTTLRTAGAIWGEVPKGGGGVVRSWNNSPQATGRRLGQLGILPGFFDEQGLSGFTAEKWALTIYGITDGSREVADREDGTRLTLPYSGVVISGGNASIAAGLGAGKFAGVGPKRVNTLNGPFTSSAEQAESVSPVLREAYGHVGAVILETFDGPQVAELVKVARSMVGLPAGQVARSAAKNMHLLVAGAAMLDRVLGTGTVIRDSAVKGALDYLGANAADPDHDADRMLSVIRDSMGMAPAKWPTVAEYIENGKPRPEFTPNGHRDPERTEIAQHGIAPVIMGVRANDGSWFAVFGASMNYLLSEDGIDRAEALAEADRRGWLRVAPTARKDGYATPVKEAGRRMIRFTLPADDDQADEPETDVPPDLPPGCPECDLTLPLHSPECSQFIPGLWDEDQADTAEPEHQAEPVAAIVTEPARPAKPERVTERPAVKADPGPFLPFGAEVRDYLSTCAAARIRPAADHAVKMIAHHGATEAAMIRATFADLTGSAPRPVATVAAPVLNDPIEPEHQAPEPEPVAEIDDRDEWTRAARKITDDATADDIEAARAIFHEVTDGTRWVSYAGQVGQAWFARLAAQYPSMKTPTPVTSAKLAEITEAGPLTRINYAVKPRGTVKPDGKFVMSYDANGQFPAAAGSAELGDGEPTVIEHPRDIGGLTGLPGYVLTTRAIRTGHPALGLIAAGTWLPMPLVRYLTRDLGLTVPAAEVVYWPEHGRRMNVYVSRYRAARERLMNAEQTPAARLALAMLKSQANAFIGMFHSKTYSHGGFYRPDWYDQIVSQAEVNALRALGKCDVAPVAKMADAAYWITDTEPTETAPYVPAGLVISGQLGKWKPDRYGPVTAELLTALRDQAPGSVRDAVIQINAARAEGQAGS